MAKELKVKMKPSHWTELTETSFYKFVNNPKKTSIIEVYAPRPDLIGLAEFAVTAWRILPTPMR